MHSSVESFYRCQFIYLLFRDLTKSIFKNASKIPSHIAQVNEKVSGGKKFGALMTLLES